MPLRQNKYSHLSDVENYTNTKKADKNNTNEENLMRKMYTCQCAENMVKIM